MFVFASVSSCQVYFGNRLNLPTRLHIGIPRPFQSTQTSSVMNQASRELNSAICNGHSRSVERFVLESIEFWSKWQLSELPKGSQNSISRSRRFTSLVSRSVSQSVSQTIGWTQTVKLRSSLDSCESNRKTVRSFNFSSVRLNFVSSLNPPLPSSAKCNSYGPAIQPVSNPSGLPLASSQRASHHHLGAAS